MIGNFESSPKWTYKPVQITNFSAIQDELKLALYHIIPTFEYMPPAFNFVWRQDIESLIPAYCELLRSFDIFDKWEYSAFITTNANIPFPIHVDSTEWETRCYGLNIPVINCEGTYTMFYDAEIEDTMVTDVSDTKNSYRLIKENTNPILIDKLESSNPAWVNLSVPHAPFSTHSKPRAIFSSRFTPELHSILYK